MKITIWKNENEIEKTYERDNYKLFFGTIEDILSVFDEIEDFENNNQLFKCIIKNRTKVYGIIKDVFPELTDDEMRRVEPHDLVAVIMDLFSYVVKNFKRKN